jgi:hypothetical protein
MLWLQLGPRVHAPIDRDPERVTGEYALHVQCPWRISGRTAIVVGAGDMYRCADPNVPEWAFDPGHPGNAVADVRLRQWIAAFAHRPLAVLGVDADRSGGFVLRLSEGFAVEVFPDSSEAGDEAEYWRLLKPGDDTPHFVMRGPGASTA